MVTRLRSFLHLFFWRKFEEGARLIWRKVLQDSEVGVTRGVVLCKWVGFTHWSLTKLILRESWLLCPHKELKLLESQIGPSVSIMGVWVFCLTHLRVSSPLWVLRLLTTTLFYKPSSRKVVPFLSECGPRLNGLSNVERTRRWSFTVRVPGTKRILWYLYNIKTK